MFQVPEKFRLKRHPILGSDESFGNNGAFYIPFSGRSRAFVIASDGMGWEHVSVHMEDVATQQQRTPTWAEMCKIKDMFWGEDDTVLQFHPKKSEYVNCHKHCLHLWRPTDHEVALPLSVKVGPTSSIKKP